MLSASILFNTNRLISSSESSWASLRDGSFIKIEGDDIHFQILSILPYKINKKFEHISKNRIKIKENMGIDITEGDNIKINYKKYSLLTVKNPIEKGEKYRIGDIISLEGGKLYTDVNTGQPIPTLLEVTNINSNGGIEQLKLINKGTYLIPTNSICNVKSGSGNGASLEVCFETMAGLASFERCVTKVDNSEFETILELNAPLQEGINDGEIEINKWEAFLSEKYTNKTKINCSYNIVKDFSPNLGIPFINRITKDPYSVYNLAIKTLDRKIGLIQNDIIKIKNYLNIQ
ncbi:MAG: hypothetical protein AABY22_06045 [Nanoarchaeota archaeon]